MTETPNPYLVDADTLVGRLPERRAVLALGGNLGERFATLQGAVRSLADSAQIAVVAVSPVYETAPVGGPSGASHYLNAVVLVDTTLSAPGLLDRTRAIEEAFGRERGEPGAPRTLDVDIVVLGDERLASVDLTVPHPRAHERAFVLRPWRDVDAGAQIPGHGRVADLLEQLDQSGVSRRDDLVLDSR